MRIYFTIILLRTLLISKEFKHISSYPQFGFFSSDDEENTDSPSSTDPSTDSTSTDPSPIGISIPTETPAYEVTVTLPSESEGATLSPEDAVTWYHEDVFERCEHETTTEPSTDREDTGYLTTEASVLNPSEADENPISGGETTASHQENQETTTHRSESFLNPLLAGQEETTTPSPGTTTEDSEEEPSTTSKSSSSWFDPSSWGKRRRKRSIKAFGDKTYESGQEYMNEWWGGNEALKDAVYNFAINTSRNAFDEILFYGPRANESAYEDKKDFPEKKNGYDVADFMSDMAKAVQFQKDPYELAYNLTKHVQDTFLGTGPRAEKGDSTEEYEETATKQYDVADMLSQLLEILQAKRSPFNVGASASDIEAEDDKDDDEKSDDQDENDDDGDKDDKNDEMSGADEDNKDEKDDEDKKGDDDEEGDSDEEEDFDEDDDDDWADENDVDDEDTDDDKKDEEEDEEKDEEKDDDSQKDDSDDDSVKPSYTNEEGKEVYDINQIDKQKKESKKKKKGSDTNNTNKGDDGDDDTDQEEPNQEQKELIKKWRRERQKKRKKRAADESDHQTLTESFKNKEKLAQWIASKSTETGVSMAEAAMDFINRQDKSNFTKEDLEKLFQETSTEPPVSKNPLLEEDDEDDDDDLDDLDDLDDDDFMPPDIVVTTSPRPPATSKDTKKLSPGGPVTTESPSVTTGNGNDLWGWASWLFAKEPKANKDGGHEDYESQDHPDADQDGADDDDIDDEDDDVDEEFISDDMLKTDEPDLFKEAEKESEVTTLAEAETIFPIDPVPEMARTFGRLIFGRRQKPAIFNVLKKQAKEAIQKKIG